MAANTAITYLMRIIEDRACRARIARRRDGNGDILQKYQF
jgi:hypothetical protein